MISQITGLLIEKIPPEIVVDVQGVGYELQVPMTTYYQLPETNQSVRLYTHFVVREDAQLLYGFYDMRDRALFRALIKTNGVGPKLALAILSGVEVNEFVRVVRNNDVGALEKLPGIGKKTAERLVIEMRDRLKDWQVDNPAHEAPSIPGSLNRNQAFEEAESALVALGYKSKEANRAVQSVAQEDLNSEELIRQALKIMVKA